MGFPLFIFILCSFFTLNEYEYLVASSDISEKISCVLLFAKLADSTWDTSDP